MRSRFAARSKAMLGYVNFLNIYGYMQGKQQGDATITMRGVGKLNNRGSRNRASSHEGGTWIVELETMCVCELRQSQGNPERMRGEY